MPKPLSRHAIPTVGDRPVEISGPSTESLQLFLQSMGDPKIAQMIGHETEASWSMAVDERLPAGRYFLQITEGQKFLFGDGKSRQGGRWLVHDVQDGAQGVSSTICAALNYTIERSPAKSWQKSSKLTIISNLVVRDDYQGRGLASWLVKSFMAEHPKARIDTSLTHFGARFFGFDEHGQRQQVDAKAAGAHKPA